MLWWNIHLTHHTHTHHVSKTWCVCCFLFSFHSFVLFFFLMATWCKYFHNDIHLWFTTLVDSYQHVTLIGVQLLPNICQKPFHYVCSLLLCISVSPSFCSWMWLCGEAHFERMKAILHGQRCSPAVGHAGPGSGCAVREKSGAAA